MTDLTHIEHLVGPLEKGREYEETVSMSHTRRLMVEVDHSDVALSEAYAVIMRLVRERYYAVGQVEIERRERGIAAERIQGLVADLAAAREEARKWEQRSCDSCVRPCDTVDESNYEGPDPFYCARYQPAEEGEA